MDSPSSQAVIDTKLRRWDLFRSIMALVAPCYPPLFSACKPENFIVTGTIICSTNSKVRLCIQEDADSFPLIILDLPITTSALAGLMEYGNARIVLQCDRDLDRSNEPMLLSVASWAMQCNGEKIGYAKRREVSGKDMLLLETMRTISTGAGILPEKEYGMGQCKYLRGQFERVVASNYSEAYYLIDPSGCSGQELSIFFLGVHQSHSEIEYWSKSNQNERYFNFAKLMEPFRYI